MLIDMSTNSRIMDSTSRPTYPTSVNFDASTLRNGAPASRARRRAISVFPTPVGPIMMMLFGMISSRMSSGVWARASGCAPRWRPPASRPPVPRYSGPAPPRSSGAAALPARGAAPPPAPGQAVAPRLPACAWARPLELQNGDVRVGVHADLGGDLERPLHDVLRGEARRRGEGPGRGERVVTARADRQDPVVRLDQLTRPRNQIG